MPRLTITIDVYPGESAPEAVQKLFDALALQAKAHAIVTQPKESAATTTTTTTTTPKQHRGPNLRTLEDGDLQKQFLECVSVRGALYSGSKEYNALTQRMHDLKAEAARRGLSLVRHRTTMDRGGLIE